LSKKFSEKLVIRCSLNENDEDKMRFENLMKQALQLIKSRNVIIKTRKTNYKTKRTTTLVKEMKSIMKKNVSEHFINLLKAMKFRVEESISKADTLRNGSGSKPNQSGWFGCGSGSGLVFQDLETTLEPNRSVRFEPVWTRKNLYIYRMFLYIECFYV
jgi:hypothetical protein